MRVLHKGATAKQRKIIRLLIGNLAICDSEFALLFSCLLFTTVVTHANNLDLDETPSNCDSSGSKLFDSQLEFLPQLSEFLSLQQERSRTEQNRTELYFTQVYIYTMYNNGNHYKHRYEFISFFGSE